MPPVMSLLGAVLVASLLGSPHCAAMCGPLVLLFAPGAKASVAMHAARLLGYAFLGAAAGGLGVALDGGGALLGLQRTALFAAAAALVVFGLVTLVRVHGFRVPAPALPRAVRDLFVRGQRVAAGWSPVRRGAAAGLLTALLPCGWLYAFVIAAAGTASPLAGSAVMAAFWAGTLPLLAGVGAGARRLLGPIGRRSPALASLILIGAGLFVLCARLDVPGLRAPRADTSVDAIRNLDPADAPCCHEGR
jgi:sulfite exporter TauE/SafE